MNAGTASLPSGQTGRRVTGLVRASTFRNNISGTASAALAVQTSATSPAADVNALVLVASISGRGQLNWCASSFGNTSGNGRTVLEVDGVVIFDQTTANTVSNQGHIAVGFAAFDGVSIVSAAPQPIQFQSGFRLLLGHSVISTGFSGFVNAEVHA